MTRAARWGVLACVTAELAAAGLWVGGLVVLVAAVIPAVFNIFGGQDAGGLFLTRAFEGYNRLVMGAIVVLIGGATWRGWMSGRGCPAVKPSKTEWVLLAAMTGLAAVIILLLHPEAAARQAEAFAIKDGTARKEALEHFFRIHQPVRVLYMLNLALGLGLLGAKVRPWLNRIEAGT